MFFLSDFCRLCLSFNGEFSRLCDDDIMEKLNACMSDLEFDDGLPSLICSHCQDNLDAFVKFRNQCLKSEFVLTSYINKFLGQVDSLASFFSTNLNVNLFKNFDTLKIPSNVKVKQVGSLRLSEAGISRPVKKCTVKLNDLKHCSKASVNIFGIDSEFSSLNVNLQDFEVRNNSAGDISNSFLSSDLNVNIVGQQQSENLPSEAEDDVFLEEDEDDVDCEIIELSPDVGLEEDENDVDCEIIELPSDNTGLNTEVSGGCHKENQQVLTEDGTITTLEQPTESRSCKRKLIDESDDSAIKKCRIDTNKMSKAELPLASEFDDPEITLDKQPDVTKHVRIQGRQAHVAGQKDKEPLHTETRAKEKQAEIDEGNRVFIKLSDLVFDTQQKLQVNRVRENTEEDKMNNSCQQTNLNSQGVLVHSLQKETNTDTLSNEVKAKEKQLETHIINTVAFNLSNTLLKNLQKKSQINSVSHNSEQNIIKSTDVPSLECLQTPIRGQQKKVLQYHLSPEIKQCEAPNINSAVMKISDKLIRPTINLPVDSASNNSNLDKREVHSSSFLQYIRELVDHIGLHDQVPTIEINFDTPNINPSTSKTPDKLTDHITLQVAAVGNNTDPNKIKTPDLSNSQYLPIRTPELERNAKVLCDQVQTEVKQLEASDCVVCKISDCEKLTLKCVSTNCDQYKEKDADVQYIKTVASNPTNKDALQDEEKSKYNHLETHRKPPKFLKTLKVCSSYKKFQIKPVRLNTEEANNTNNMKIIKNLNTRIFISSQDSSGNFVSNTFKPVQSNSSQVPEVKSTKEISGSFERNEIATHSIPKTVEKLDLEKKLTTHFINKNAFANPTDKGSLKKSEPKSTASNNKEPCQANFGNLLNINKNLHKKGITHSDKILKVIVPPGTRITSDVAVDRQSVLLETGQSVLLDNHSVFAVNNEVEQDSCEIKLNFSRKNNVSSKCNVHSLKESFLKTVNLSYNPKGNLYSISNAGMESFLKTNKLKLPITPVLKSSTSTTQSILKANNINSLLEANPVPESNNIKMSVCSPVENLPAEPPQLVFLNTNYKITESNTCKNLNPQLKPNPNVPKLTNEDVNTIRKTNRESVLKVNNKNSVLKPNASNVCLLVENPPPELPQPLVLANNTSRESNVCKNSYLQIKTNYYVSPTTIKSEDSGLSIFDEDIASDVPILANKDNIILRNTVLSTDIDWPEDKIYSNGSDIEFDDFKDFFKKNQDFPNQAEAEETNKFSTGPLTFEDQSFNNKWGINLNSTVLSSSNDIVGGSQSNYNKCSVNSLPTAIRRNCVTPEEKLTARNALLDVLILADESNKKQNKKNTLITDDLHNDLQGLKVCRGRKSQNRGKSSKVKKSQNKTTASEEVIQKTDFLPDIVTSSFSKSIHDPSSSSRNSQNPINKASNLDSDSEIDVIGVDEETYSIVMNLRANMLECDETLDNDSKNRRRQTARETRANFHFLCSVLPKRILCSNVRTQQQIIDTASLYISALTDESENLRSEHNKVLERNRALQNKLKHMHKIKWMLEGLTKKIF